MNTSATPADLVNVILSSAQRPHTTFDSDASQKLVRLVDWTKSRYEPSTTYRSPYYPSTGISTDLFDRVCSAVAAVGDVEMLNWLVGNGYTVGSIVWLGGAVGGHLTVFDWAVNEGILLHDYTGIVAAYHGRRDVLEWIHDLYYDWRMPVDLPGGKCSIYSLYWKVCAAAALGGHLEFIKWAHSDGYEYDELASAAAAGEGRLDILKWAHENGLPITWMADATARNADHDVHEWLASIGCDSSADMPCECLTPLDVLYSGLMDV